MSPSTQSMSPPLTSSAEVGRIYSTMFEKGDRTSLQAVLVTSGWQGEGKSTLVAQLAAFAAMQKKKKVLVIDCNWFSPTIHTLFGLPDLVPTPQDAEEENPLSPAVMPDKFSNLSIITASSFPRRDHSFDGCSYAFFSDIIRVGKQKYDQIFIDASALFPTNHNMNDPLILGKHVDGAIVVALANVTPRSKTKRACCALQEGGTTVLGVVANQWKNPLALESS